MHSGDPMLGLPQGLRIRPSVAPWSARWVAALVRSNHKKVTLPPETSIMAHSYADLLAYLRDDPNITKLTILRWLGLEPPSCLRLMD